MSKCKKLLTISFVAAFVVSLLTAFTAFNGYSAKADETLSGTNVAMRVGAGVRIEEPAGIRFRGEVNAKYFTDGVLNKNYTVGMLIVPSQLLEGELTAESAKAVNTQVEKFDLNAIEDVSDGMVAFNVAMVDVPVKYYTTDLTARAYVFDGEKYEYSAIENMQTRSIGQVASIALSKGRTDALLTTIVNSCNPSFTIADSEEDEVNITAKIGDTINISATPANFIAKVNFNGDALSYDNKNVITVSGYSGEVVTAKVSLGKVEKTLNVNIYTDETELKLSEKLAGIKCNAGKTVAGSPDVKAYIENNEPVGLEFGAKVAGEVRARFTVPKTLKSGHKYVLSFSVDKTGEKSLWGNFGLGITDIITLSSSFSPTMWGYVNGSDSTSHDSTAKNAKNVIITGTHENYEKYVCRAEFVMTSDVEEIIFDIRMSNAAVGSNAVIKAISLTEDESYYIEAQKDGALKTVLNGIGLTNAVISVGNPEFSCLTEGDKVVGLKVGSKGSGEIRFRYVIPKTLESGKTYKMSFTINKVGGVELWGNFQTGIKDIVRLATPDNGYFPSLWGYAYNANTASHATATDYAENVKLTGSPSGSTTFNETATFTMLQSVNEVVIDFRMLDCQAGDLFTITAFNIEEVVSE